MVAVGVELGARMAEREPPDVEGATRFATGLLLAAAVAVRLACLVPRRSPPRSAEFSPEGAYLNTATLRPAAAHARSTAMAAAADEWRHGRTGFDGWDRSVGAARAAFARLAGVDTGDVAIGSAVSAFAGLVAAALPAGARVLCARGRLHERAVPVPGPGAARRAASSWCRSSGFAEALGPQHDLVAVSAVQSADGRIADLDALAAAAARTTRARSSTRRRRWAGSPLDCAALRLHRVRGLQVAAEPARHRVLHASGRSGATSCVPHAAGWYAGEDVPASYYGAPLRLAHDARRFDLSPAWLNWVGAAPSLALLEEVGDRRDRRARRRAGEPAARRARAAARRLGDRVGRRAARRTRPSGCARRA